MFLHAILAALLISQVSAEPVGDFLVHSPFHGGRKLLATQEKKDPERHLSRGLLTMRVDADGAPCGRDLLPVCTGTDESPLVGFECDWGWIGEEGVCVVYGTHNMGGDTNTPITMPTNPDPMPSDLDPMPSDPAPVQSFPAATGGSDFSGELTYYGTGMNGAGVGGACTQNWVPPGFTTVALNRPQYESQNECGTCVSACFTNEELDEGERCFNAIIDNMCPECAYGDLDLGEGGSGRWPVTWSKIPCPASSPLQFSLQGSNASYAKVKAEGGPASVIAMTCNGMTGEVTPDSYFVFRDNENQSLASGLSCDVTFSNGETGSGSF